MGIADTEETAYLERKLSQGPRPTPTFANGRFRELSPGDRDPEVTGSSDMQWINRVVGELEVAQRMIRWAIEKREKKEPPKQS